ncbi:enoyl-CoA hydratase/isomerase family protein [Pseudonocardia sp. WMMC193]|uniref:enoyl-CoA hydratase/isomerase family protein n=1 Tax=Pseudonocardia sp. WMMC193 TaxID=2911965 RepID=UPI001F322474|nr:enoyl-CoA hydratase/isomerase family protein [Pseudonocardia sp. WMMC193]MCF7550768.1 enoyl-CoA hydratase/isomerase family protein [Pseudonocardia sp. WMMC193]
MTSTSADHLTVEISGHVAVVELNRPPSNFLSLELISSLADTYDRLDADPDVRAIVLAAAGKHFCAGADFGGDGLSQLASAADLYGEAVRIFEAATPVVAAVQGGAIGGGLGLALSADFRVAGPGTRFAANFTQLGFHPGFGITATLPPLVGQQRAAELMYTGERLPGPRAHEIGLADELVADAEIRSAATAFAARIAAAAPLAVVAVRATLRRGLADRVRAATAVEAREQARLRQTEDFREGVAAYGERRPAQFQGR